MSFELGLVMGLGRSAMREREERRRQEELARKQADEQNSRSLGTLQKLVDTDDLLPDEARNVAAQHLFRLATNPKAKDTDFQKAIQETIAAANRPRPVVTPQSIAANATQRIASQDYSALDGLMPGMGAGMNETLRSTVVPQLPAPPTASGLLTRDEIGAREEAELRRKLALQQEFSTPKDDGYTVEGPDGIYVIDKSTGKERGYTPFRTPPVPKQDLSRSPFEVWIDPTTPPELRERAFQAMTMQYTNQGDQMRTGGGAAGSGPRYQRQVFQKPDGTYTEVLTNPYDPSEPPIRRDFGGGIDKPMTDGAKTAKAQTAGTITMLDGLLAQIDSGTIDPNDVFGKWNELGYRARSSGWFPFLDAPDTATSNVRTDLANFNNELTKLRSGAAVSAAEWSRLAKELPVAGLAPEEVVNRIRRTTERLRRIFLLRYGPNGVGDANAFPGDVEGGASGPAPTPTTATTGAAGRIAQPTPAVPAPTAPGRLPAPPPPPRLPAGAVTQGTRDASALRALRKERRDRRIRRLGRRAVGPRAPA